MLGARRSIKIRFRHILHDAGAVEQQLADLFCHGVPARLARHDDGAPLFFQRCLQQLDLGGLARTVPTLKGDKHAFSSS